MSTSDIMVYPSLSVAAWSDFIEWEDIEVVVESLFLSLLVLITLSFSSSFLE